MRHVWISLMLCACCAGAAACSTSASPQAPMQASPPAATPARAATRATVGTADPAQAQPVKVSAVTTPAPAAAQALAPSKNPSWRDDPLAAPLLASALAMVMIALRRGGR